MRASDQSEPLRTATVPVQISISRDQYPPTTTRPVYESVIDENERTNGSSLIRIGASDPDLKVQTSNFRLKIWGGVGGFLKKFLASKTDLSLLIVMEALSSPCLISLFGFKIFL